MPITDPTDIADLSLWLSAESLSLSDGDPVTSWVDQSPNAGVFSAPGGGEPSYQANELNGLPVVRFDGISDSLASGAFDALGVVISADGLKHTCFVVLKQAGADASNCVLDWLSGGVGKTYTLYYTFADTLYFDNGNNAAGGRISQAQPGGWDDAWHIVESYRDTADAEIVVDGSSLVSSSSLSDGLASGSAPLRIGGNSGPSVWFGGDIAEIVFYKRGLNSGERTDVYNYLNSKYFAVVPDQEVTLPRLAAANTFYNPTVTPAAATVALPLLAAAGQFFAPTVIYDQVITMPLLAAADAFYAPAVGALPAKGLTVTISDRLAEG